MIQRFALTIACTGLAVFVPVPSVRASSEIDLAVHMIQHTRQQAIAVSAGVQHQQDIVDSLRKLQIDGHASFLEVATAETTLKILQAQSQCVDEFLTHLSDLKQVHATAFQADQHPVDEIQGVLLTIPGLAESALTSSLATVRLPPHPELVSLLDTETVHSRQRPERVKARAQLVTRLKLNSDGSAAAEREIVLAQLKQIRETAFGGVASQVIPLLVAQKSITPFSVDGDQVQDTRQLLAVMQRKLSHSHLQAARASLLHRITASKTLKQRLAELPADAVMRGEKQMIAWRLQHEVAQRSVIEGQLQHLEMLAELGVSNWQTTSLNPEADDSGQRLLRQLTETRIHEATIQRQALEEELREVHDRTEQVRSLARHDDFFAGEATHAELRRDVLRAELNSAEKLEQQRRLEATLLQSMYPQGCQHQAEALHWHSRLVDLFHHLSRNSADVQTAKAQLKLSTWKLQGMTRLAEEGCASWMEVTQAGIQHAEARNKLAAVRSRRSRFRTVADVLEKLQPEEGLVATAVHSAVDDSPDQLADQ